MKKILAMLCVVCMVFSMAGCGKLGLGKKKQVAEEQPTVTQEDIDAYEEALGEMQTEVDTLEKALAIYDPKYVNEVDFRKKSKLQGGKVLFNKVDDKIILNGTIITNTGNKSNTASITLSNKITITPNKSWNVSLSTAETMFSMKNAYGTLRISEYEDDWNVDGVTYDILKPYFKENGLDLQSTRDIFVGDNKVGEEAKTRIGIYDSTTVGNSYKIKFGDIMTEEEANDGYNASGDNEVVVTVKAKDKVVDGTLRIGILKTNLGLIQYEFIAENDNGDVLIDNLLNTIKVGEKELYLQ